jgi:hypothetical protein
MKTGKVYFVSAPGRIKIGFTRFPERRLVALRRADMENLTVIDIIDGERALEKRLHDLLSVHRLRGEWFNDCHEVRGVIEDAVAGKHSISEDPKPEPAYAAQLNSTDDPPYSPEFQIVQRLLDEAESSLGRSDNKYEVRGRVEAALAAADVFMQQRLGGKNRTVAGG